MFSYLLHLLFEKRQDLQTWFYVSWTKFITARVNPSLTHWGRVTHICVSKLTIIDSDNGLSPGRRQAIIWTNAGILLIRTLGTNFSENLSSIHAFSFKKMHLKMLSVKWRPSCLGLNVPRQWQSWCWYALDNFPARAHMAFGKLSPNLWCVSGDSEKVALRLIFHKHYLNKYWYRSITPFVWYAWVQVEIGQPPPECTPLWGHCRGCLLFGIH